MTIPLYAYMRRTPVIYMSKLSFNYNLIYAGSTEKRNKNSSAQSTPYIYTIRNNNIIARNNNKTISKNATRSALWTNKKINNLL